MAGACVLAAVEPSPSVREFEAEAAFVWFDMLPVKPVFEKPGAVKGCVCDLELSEFITKLLVDALRLALGL